MKKMFFLIFAFMIVGGCSQNEQGQTTNNTNSTNNGINVTEVKNTTIDESNRKQGQQIARRLTALAVKVPHVNDATAVVLGKYAIVGIDVDKDIDRSQVGTIKYSVGESLQKDPDGANAVIVADPDLNERVKEVASDIENGRPIRGILNELSDITSRIIPEVPSDPLEQTPSKTMNNQKESIENQGEKQQLEKKQNKQSKEQNL